MREIESDEGVLLIAGFETNEKRIDLLERFAGFSPEWELEEDTDWVAQAEEAWPGRVVGARLYLAPAWSRQETPAGRLRLIHNPGLACGTGEHPCSQLALMALESVVRRGDAVADVGTGSGILAIGAVLLGAGLVVGVDLDETALGAARENFGLNGLRGNLAAGSADALREAIFDVTVANISGTVLLSIWADLLRITKRSGSLIATGFTEGEIPGLLRYLPGAAVSELDGWGCLVARLVDVLDEL